MYQLGFESKDNYLSSAETTNSLTQYVQLGYIWFIQTLVLPNATTQPLTTTFFVGRLLEVILPSAGLQPGWSPAGVPSG